MLLGRYLGDGTLTVDQLGALIEDGHLLLSLSHLLLERLKCVLLLLHSLRQLRKLRGQIFLQSLLLAGEVLHNISEASMHVKLAALLRLITCCRHECVDSL